MACKTGQAELEAIRGWRRQCQHEQGNIQGCRSLRNNTGSQGSCHTSGRFQNVRSLLKLHGRTKVRKNRLVCDLVPDLHPQVRRDHEKRF